MQGLLKELQEARFTGASSIEFRDRKVTYKSDAQMARIESELKRRLKEACGQTSRKRVGLVTFSKGR